MQKETIFFGQVQKYFLFILVYIDLRKEQFY